MVRSLILSQNLRRHEPDPKPDRAWCREAHELEGTPVHFRKEGSITWVSCIIGAACNAGTRQVEFAPTMFQRTYCKSRRAPAICVVGTLTFGALHTCTPAKGRHYYMGQLHNRGFLPCRDASDRGFRPWSKRTFNDLDELERLVGSEHRRSLRTQAAPARQSC